MPQLGVAIAGAAAAIVASPIAIPLLLAAGAVAIGIFLLPKSTDKKKEDTEELQSGEDVLVSTIFGRCATAGALVYHNEWGSNNKNIELVYQLGYGQYNSLQGVFVNNDLVTLTGSNSDTNGFGVSQFSGMNIKFYDGNPAQTADAGLVSHSSPAGRWTSNHRGVFIPYVIIRMTYNEDLYGSSLPTFIFDVKGLKCYDPRSDSTQIGGSGAQRWGDLTTYVWTENPAVCLLNYKLGIWYNGVLILGEGRSQVGVSLTYFNAAANIADEVVVFPDTSTSLPRYHVGAEITDGSDDQTVTHLFEEAMAGYGVEIGGAYRPLPGHQQSPVMTITDDDISSTGQTIARNRLPPNETYTAVQGNFSNPASVWKQITYGMLSDSAVDAADGGQRLLTLDLPFVNKIETAQMLAEIKRRRDIFQKNETVILRPKFALLEPGDLITRDKALFIDPVTMLVMSTEEQETGEIKIDLRELDNSVFPASGDTFMALPQAIGTAPAIPSRLLQLAGFTTSGVTLIAPGGAQKPGIKVVWTAIDDDSVDRVVVKYWPTAGDSTADAAYATIADISVHSAILQPLLPNTQYSILANIFTTPPRATSPTSTNTVTTPNTDISNGVIDGAIGQDQLDAIFADLEDWMTSDGATIPAVAQEVTDRIADVNQEVSDRTAAILSEQTSRLVDTQAIAADARTDREQLLHAAAQMQELAVIELRDRQRIETTLTSSLHAAQASFTDSILVATGPDSALVLRDTQLQASIDGEVTNRSAAINTVTAAYVAADTVVASTVTTLSSQIRGSYAGADVTLAAGLIGSLYSTMVTADLALSTSISLVSAGVGILFDWYDFWPFDTTVQGWTGNGAPGWSPPGWLRPANDASDPYIISPDNLNLNGDAYKQIKALIRKTGTPTWEGYLWWKGNADTTWDAARRVSISEPSYVSGQAVVTWDVTWTGTIKQYRIDLTSVADASNYQDIDWIADGRPSPGASQAQLTSAVNAVSTALTSEISSRTTLQSSLYGASSPGTALGSLSSGLVYDERTARTAGDSTNATAITAVGARMDSAETNISALTTAQSTLSSSVSTLSGTVTTLSSAVTDLTANLAGKADISVTNGITARIDAIGDDSITTLASAFRNLKSEIDMMKSGLVANGTANQMTRDQISRAIVNSTSYTNTQITASNDSITALGQTVSALDARLFTAEGTVAAQGSTLSSQAVTLTSQGSSISANTTSINALNASLSGGYLTAGGVASAFSVTNASVTVAQTTADGKNKVFRQTSIPNAVAAGDIWFDSDDNNKVYRATAPGTINWVATDDGRIASLVSTTTSQASDITSLQSALNGFTTTNAVANAVTSLTTSVTAVQTTADSKNKVFRQTSAPTAIQAGDLWFDSDDNNKVYRATAPGTGSWVATDDSRIATNASAITAIDTRLTSAEGVNTSQATAITSLNTSITSINGTLTSQSTFNTNVTASVNEVSASGAFKATAFAGAGGWSNIGIQAEATDGSTPSTASIFLQAKTTGESRVVIKAAETYFLDNSGNIVAGFTATGAAFNNAYIVNLETTNLHAHNIDADAISIAGSVLTATIATLGASQVEFYNQDGDQASSGTSTYTVLASTPNPIVVPDSNTTAVAIQFNAFCYCNLADVHVTYQILRGATVLGTYEGGWVLNDNLSVGDTKRFPVPFVYFDSSLSAGSYNYSVQAIVREPNGTNRVAHFFGRRLLVTLLKR